MAVVAQSDTLRCAHWSDCVVSTHIMAPAVPALHEHPAFLHSKSFFHAPHLDEQELVAAFQAHSALFASQSLSDNLPVQTVWLTQWRLTGWHRADGHDEPA